MKHWNLEASRRLNWASSVWFRLNLKCVNAYWVRKNKSHTGNRMQLSWITLLIDNGFGSIHVLLVAASVRSNYTYMIESPPLATYQLVLATFHSLDLSKEKSIRFHVNVLFNSQYINLILHACVYSLTYSS